MSHDQNVCRPRPRPRPPHITDHSVCELSLVNLSFHSLASDLPEAPITLILAHLSLCSLLPGYQPCYPCFPSTALARGSTDWQNRGSNYPSHAVTFLLEGQLIWLSLLCCLPRIHRNILSWRSVTLSSQGRFSQRVQKWRWEDRQCSPISPISFRNWAKHIVNLRRKRKKEARVGSEWCNWVSFSLSFVSLGILLIGLNRNWTGP